MLLLVIHPATVLIHDVFVCVFVCCLFFVVFCCLLGVLGLFLLVVVVVVVFLFFLVVVWFGGVGGLGYNFHNLCLFFVGWLVVGV